MNAPSVWETQPAPLVIADVGNAHDGVIEKALELVDAVRRAGCDVIKFRRRSVRVDTPLADLLRQIPSGIDTLFDVIAGREFRREAFGKIAVSCRAQKLGWFVFSADSETMRDMDRIGSPRHEAPLHVLKELSIERQVILRAKRPILISTVLSDRKSVLEDVARLSTFPGPLANSKIDIGVSVRLCDCPACSFTHEHLVLADLQKYLPLGVKFGVSEHWAKGTSLLSAVRTGVSFVEIPVSLDGRSIGRGKTYNPDQLSTLVGRIRAAADSAKKREDGEPPETEHETVTSRAAPDSGSGHDGRDEEMPMFEAASDRDLSRPYQESPPTDPPAGSDAASARPSVSTIRRPEGRAAGGAFCGLDFGTSNSEIGLFSDGRARLLALEGTRKRMPSTIFFENGRESPYIGEAAIEAYLRGGCGRMFWAIKSVLGTTLMNPPADRTVVQGRPVTFGSLIGLILRRMKCDAEQCIAGPLLQVVLGRPVHFSDTDMELDRRAESMLRRSALDVGFRDVIFEYEPIAAALDFERTLENESLAVVADIGGGTSDFAVIRLGPRRRGRADRRDDILAVDGVHAGGTDLDRAFSLATVMPVLGRGALIPATAGLRTLDGEDDRPVGGIADQPTLGGGLPQRAAAKTKSGVRPPSRPPVELPMPDWIYHRLASWLEIGLIYGSPLLDNIYRIVNGMSETDRSFKRLERVLREERGHEVARRVEDAKIRLSDAPASFLDLDCVERNFRLDVTRSEFNIAVREQLSRIEGALVETIRKAGVRPEQVNVAILTGGSVFVPAIRAIVERVCSQASTGDADQFGGIALGLTLRAEQIFGRGGPH